MFSRGGFAIASSDMETRNALTLATVLWAAAFAFADSAEDAGTPWKVFPIYGGGYVQNVCMAESDPNRWYCYVDVGGPYRSDDAGAHWYPLHGNFTVAQRAKCADHVRTLSVDPRDADSLVLASGNRFDRPAGVFVSRDGGYHSAPLKDGLRLPSGDSRHVAVNDGRLYLMTSGSGVFTREIPKKP